METTNHQNSQQEQNQQQQRIEGTQSPTPAETATGAESSSPMLAPALFSQPKPEESMSPATDWKVVCRAGGALRQVPLETGTNGWSTPPGELFNVRGPNYFTKKQKTPAGECLLQPLGMDWLKSSAKLDHVLARPDNRVMHALSSAQAMASANAKPLKAFVLAINLQVPGREHHSAVFYFCTEESIPPESLLHRFIHGDDSFRNSRFKLINRIVRGPWIVRTTVGNHAACLLGKALTCTYLRGPDYLEIDVDIGSSTLASAILHLALGYVNSVSVDMAFLVESQSDDELPEKILGSVRVAQIDMESATPVDPYPAARGSVHTHNHSQQNHHQHHHHHHHGSESSWRKFSRSFSLLGHASKPSKVEVEHEQEEKIGKAY